MNPICYKQKQCYHTHHQTQTARGLLLSVVAHLSGRGLFSQRATIMELRNCGECKSIIRRRSSKSGMYFCGTTCKANWQRSQKPVSREWLVQKYIDERLDATQIGLIVDRDPKSVWNWLVGYGIPTRQRGYASSAHWMQSGEPSAFKGRKHSSATRMRLQEIAIADGRVPFDPMIGPPLKGKRGAEVHTWKGGITPERQSFYSSVEWKESVKAVWTRDNAACQRCYRLKNADRSISFDIHHIVSFACVELRAEVSNLVLLCEPCHYWVHSSENISMSFIKEISNVA